MLADPTPQRAFGPAKKARYRRDTNDDAVATLG